MKKTPLLLVISSLALFAAGCGGDDKKKDSADSGARGYAETGQAINDVCTRAKAEIDPIAKGANGDAKHDAPIIEKLVATNQKYVDELKKIKPDPKLQEAFDTYVAAVDNVQAKSNEALAVAKSGDSEAYRMAVEAVNGLDSETHPAARALGAMDCTKD
jgi:hypothetical protein